MTEETNESAKVRVNIKECKGSYVKLSRECFICRICNQPVLMGQMKPCVRDNQLKKAIKHWNRQALFYGSVG